MYYNDSKDFKAKLAARDLLKQLELDIPCNLNEILNVLGISYDERALSDGFDGALICKNENYGMIINGNIPYSTRKRFTVAHELGHYWIPEHHKEEIYYCTGSNIGSFDNKKSQTEYEADIFAAEFLMPESIIKNHIQKLIPSIDSIKTIAEKYQTSLTATALRFIDFTLEPCALILMQDKNIRWVRKSKSFRYELKKKPDDCFAYDVIESGANHVCDSLYSRLWLLNCDKEYIWEDVENFKYLNQQLIILKTRDYNTNQVVTDEEEESEGLFD